ncbi:HelD family protein [Natronoglycomyces albus]|uniref:ATP-binding domain-containing protein n=1 Tax=Natronoglycomyces albus TaxID=2811108 RepID=A0A895XSU5_9ACTN|nr:ATP-binding domain-containing protein [Natronoglycomyces albus]QSB04708.1 ATP-binding domain-containing protein [Natronoglycomyces albus]
MSSTGSTPVSTTEPSPAPDLEHELAAERSHLERATAAMADMYEATDHLTALASEEIAEGSKNLAISDITSDDTVAFALGKHRAQRLADLRHRPDIPLFFGRLWMGEEPTNPDEDYHIGRRHIRDESYHPLVLDWRARVAERYYRASVHNRQDVLKRRRFGFGNGTITGFEDEDLTAGIDATSDILATEIERPRTGPMRDIVATIQPEQDELIRRALSTSLCVQGAPGTGKTAVGLHRAAWLLYTHREQLAKNGLLIIGPNENFLRYISQVLPTLGEASVRQLTIDTLLSTQAAKHTDTPEAAYIKHNERMAEICRRAVWSHVSTVPTALEKIGQEPEGMVISDEGWRWRLGYQFLSDLATDAGNEHQTYLAGLDFLKQGIISGIRRQAELRTGQSPDRKWESKIGRNPVVKGFLDAIWPRLKAKDVLRRLYTDCDFRAQCCEGLLTTSEQDHLAMPGRSLKLTAADIVLLDELESCLTWSNLSGHLVIDEAQDLSPMQARAIARRSAHGSITVLGDLAQGTTPWAAHSWKELLGHLGKPEAELCELTIGYRVPEAIVELANNMLPHLDVDVAPAKSIRRDGKLDHVHAPNPLTGAKQAITQALAEEGLVGVIAHDADVPALIEALGPTLAQTQRVEIIPASVAKGLEFDHVVVVEPAHIAAVERIGLRLLYVAVTRAVSRLTLVHSLSLPQEMGVG